MSAVTLYWLFRKSHAFYILDDASFFGMVVDGKSLSNVSYIDILYRCTAMIHTNKNIPIDSGDISYGMNYELLMILNYSSNCCSSASIVSVLYQQFKMHFCSRGMCIHSSPYPSSRWLAKCFAVLYFYVFRIADAGLHLCCSGPGPIVFSASLVDIPGSLY